MKVQYTGISDISLTNGRIYEVQSVECDRYRIIDDTEEDYLFPPDEFVIAEA